MSTAELAALLVGIGAILSALGGLIVAVTKLRNENTRQHESNLNTTAQKFTELRDDIYGLGQNVDRKIDRLEDKFTDQIERHENVHHRRKRHLW